MADNKDNKTPGIFQKAVEAGNTWLEAQIHKAKTEINEKEVKGSEDTSEFVYGKTVVDEPSYAINSQGYKEKPHRIIDTHLKQMSLKDSIVAAIIQTRQNQAANHSRLVKSEQDRGFIIRLKDEESFLREIKEQLRGEVEAQEAAKDESEDMEAADIEKSETLSKADEFVGDGLQREIASDREGEGRQESSDDGKSDDEVEEINWELERKAKEKLEEEIRDRRKKVEDFVLNCGEMKQRPFETKKWDLDAVIRAWVRDTYTYDRIATEMVPNKMNKPHHYFPADASTIKFSSPALKKYKMFPGAQTNVDLLYPEKQIAALEKKDALELDDKLLENDQYKYVQVLRGRIERAYTEDEMKVGIRNPTTDVYNNGYGIAELELLVSLVSSHLNTEYYNKSYFTQGFSAKGILHLKAPIPRRKLETIRQQWHHMIRGTRNSFQTPIFAGMDEVNWIPLTQNHSDIEFSGWMNYLIKMMCAIYQIDPKEVGIVMKDEGGKVFNGDDTEERREISRDKGLYPLMRFLEKYINKNVIDMIDSDFELIFTGLDAESGKQALERQEKEAKFKKTVNEIRAEDGLPPLPGMDDFIMSSEYLQWYTQFSDKGQKLAEKNLQMGATAPGDEGDPNIPKDEDLDNMLDTPDEDPDMSKSLKIEYYKLK